ncbi:MAG: FecR domain-containing protein [Spirochaetes bacterium]|nr:FecR domain-containing protein [Spirochaetota bacterium]
MVLRRLYCCFLLAIIVFLILSCTPQPKSVSAHLIFMQGDVTIIRNEVNVPVILGSIVQPEDIITTGNQSIAVVQIADRAVVHITSNSKLAVKTLVATSTTLYLERGEIISKVERLQKAQEYRVKTPSVVASVRGTQFLVKADEKIGKVAVHTGSVSVKPVIEETKIEEIQIEETIVDGGKEAIVTVEKEKAAKEIPVSVKEISIKDKMKIEEAGKIELLPQEVVIKPEALEKVRETIKQNIEKIGTIESSTEEQLRQQIKKERIERLMQQKTRTLEEIKEACERIDVIRLYSGKQIQGAIISRGDSYKILTTTGVIDVPKKDVRSVSVMR